MLRLGLRLGLRLMLLLLLLQLLLLLLPLEAAFAADSGVGTTCGGVSSCVPPDSTGAADRVFGGARIVGARGTLGAGGG